MRDSAVDFLKRYHALTGIAFAVLLDWLGLSPRKFTEWRKRYGKACEHNALVPRDHWIEPQERAAIVAYAREHPLESYRSLTFRMLDEDVAAVSPSTTYRILKAERLIAARSVRPSKKGTGFVQPLAPHEHWHVDFSYINAGGTFYYMCTVLDGCSRAILSCDVRTAMKEADAEIVIQRAREAYPEARPRIITDNGSQFTAREFREFVRLCQSTQVFCSPGHPQSNGKLERFHRTLKEMAVRPKSPLDLDDARRIVGDFVRYYNEERLHSAIGYIAPLDRIAGRHKEIHAARDKKLENAREMRRIRRQNEQARVA